MRRASEERIICTASWRKLRPSSMMLWRRRHKGQGLQAIQIRNRAREIIEDFMITANSDSPAVVESGNGGSASIKFALFTLLLHKIRISLLARLSWRPISGRLDLGERNLS